MNGFASYVKEGERLDDLQLNGLYIIQNPSHFCFGGDSVGLADFASVKAGETVADLCTGSGVIPILLSAKTRARSFVGIEIITEVAEMARRSVLMNGLSDRIEIINDDIKNAPDMFKNDAFDVVTANPPYHRGGLRSPEIAKASAKHEISCQLPQLISVSAALLKNGGRLYVSYPTGRLVDLLCEMRRNNLEPKTMRFAPRGENKPPSAVFVEAVKGGGPWLNIIMD